MFDDIGDKLKGLSKIILFTSILIGCIWLLYSLSKWSDYQDYLKYGDINDFFSHAYNAKAGIVGSITLSISGIILSMFIYGFGEIIDRLISIDNKINSQVVLGNVEAKVSAEAPNKKEMTRAELYDKLNDK